MPVRVVLFGIGSPIVVEYVETCLRLGWSIAAGVKNRDGEVYFEDSSRIVEAVGIDKTLIADPCLCPLFTPANRAAATREAAAAGFRFEVAMIDPSAIVASTTRIGGGSYVNAGVVLAASASISRHALINRRASIGHHVRVGDFASIGPGAIIGSLSVVEHGAMIGAGAIVLPKVTIGAFAVVGAGAVVTRDVLACVKVVGNPARVTAENLAVFDLPDAT
jgi:UDP-3-O-[3-hydroxymyristoyl] glucosamine N-acyltransferase